MDNILNILKAVILGVVEGITEWLPISSTGHMILIDEFLKLNMSQAFKDMFLVVIQLGAIMAVVLLFWSKLWPFSKKEKYFIKTDIMMSWFKIIVACIPAAIIELAWGDFIEATFYNYKVVAIMLVLIGALFILVENFNKNKNSKINSLAEISFLTECKPDPNAAYYMMELIFCICSKYSAPYIIFFALSNLPFST